jgi:hypothetical protein
MKSKIKCGQYELTLWEKQHETYKTNTITLQKSWKDGDDWKQSQVHILLNDVPKVQALLQKMYEEALEIKKLELPTQTDIF